MTTSFSYMAAARPMSGVKTNPAGAILFLGVLVAPFWILYAWANGLSTLRFLAGNRGGWWLLGTILMVLVSWYYKDLAMPH